MRAANSWNCAARSTRPGSGRTGDRSFDPGWVQNGYVSLGTAGHTRPRPEPWNRPSCSGNVPECARASLTRLSLVMKGSPVRVRASALKDLQNAHFGFLSRRRIMCSNAAALR
jgi:hypothetical protein